MSAYENVVSGKLKLKGKALDVKAGGVKKKRKHKHYSDRESQEAGNEFSGGGGDDRSSTDHAAEDVNEAGQLTDGRPPAPDHLTPAEKRYIEQRERIDMHRLAKTANKSHRDRIENFNQYLANLSEHYDIPKVGPG